MGLFDRLSKSIRSTLDGATDPDAAADYDYERMKERLRDLDGALTDLVTERKRLESRRENLDERIDEYERTSEEAMQGGDESRARTALEAKKQAIARRDEVTERIQRLEAAEADLREKREDLEARVERFRTDKETLKARRKAGMEPGGRGEEIDRAIERATDEVEEMQARSAALEELEGDGALDDGRETEKLDRELDAGATDSDVEAELETIRKNLRDGDEE